MDPTKYDDWDYHEEAAEEAGQPAEYGFTHIGLFLAWLIRHDLFGDEAVFTGHVEKVRDGRWEGSELRDDVDGKLIDDMLTAEGAAFATARYDAYLSAFRETFADRPDYSIPDDAETYVLIAPVIDQLYAEWVEAGRPAPERDESGESDERQGLDPPASPIDVESARAEFDIDEDIRELRAMGYDVISLADLPKPHDDPDLEALMPAVIDGASIEMWSVKGYRSAALDRSLKSLGVSRKGVMVASCVEGVGDDILSAQFLRIPGVDEGRLADEFVLDPERIGGWTFDLISVGDRTIGWTEGLSEGRPRAGATWARDGLVISLLGPPDLLRRLIPLMRDTVDWHLKPRAGTTSLPIDGSVASTPAGHGAAPSDTTRIRHPWSDAFILAYVPVNQPTNLHRLIDDMDYSERLRPGFAVLSFGLMRLQAAGYVTVEQDGSGKWWVSATEATRDLDRDWRQAHRLGTYLAYLERTLGTPPIAGREVEDRTLGGLPGLTEEDVERADKEGTDWPRPT